MDSSPNNLQLFLNRPVVKWLVVVNLVLFPIGLYLSEGTNFTRLALVPEIFFERLDNFQLVLAALDLFRYQFIHENFDHIMFNMIFLVTMGVALEYRLGTRRFLVLYFASGTVAGLVFVATAPPLVAMIGASGSIAGVMGAALVLTREQPLVGPFAGFTVKAVHVLLSWFAWQVYLLHVSVSTGNVQAGEFVLHVSGFITGFALALLWQRQLNRREPVSWRQ